MRLGSGGLYCFDPTHSWSWPRHHFQLNLVSNWNPILHFLKKNKIKNHKLRSFLNVFGYCWVTFCQAWEKVLPVRHVNEKAVVSSWTKEELFSLSLSFFCWQVPLQLQSRELPENDAVNKWMGGLTSVTSLTFQFILIHDSVIVKCRL